MLESSSMRSRSHSSDRCKRGPSARTTCSSVISGFFFPQVRRLGSQEVHADSRTKPVTYQTLVGSHLERTESTVLFGPFKPHFHMPTSKGRFQHFLQRRTFGGVADEVPDLARFSIAGYDQPVRPIRGTGFDFGIFGHQINPRKLDFPHARASRRVLDVDALPRLLAEYGAEATKVVHLLRGMRRLRTVAGRPGRPATRRSPFTEELADTGRSTRWTPMATAR